MYSENWVKIRDENNLCGVYPITDFMETSHMREQIGIWIDGAGHLVLDEPCLGSGTIAHMYPNDLAATIRGVRADLRNEFG